MHHQPTHASSGRPLTRIRRKPLIAAVSEPRACITRVHIACIDHTACVCTSPVERPSVCIIQASRLSIKKNTCVHARDPDERIPSLFGRSAATKPDHLESVPQVDVEPAIADLKVGGDDVGTDQEDADAEGGDGDGTSASGHSSSSSSSSSEEEDEEQEEEEQDQLATTTTTTTTDADGGGEGGGEDVVNQSPPGISAPPTSAPPAPAPGHVAYPRWCGEDARVPWDRHSDTARRSVHTLKSVDPSVACLCLERRLVSNS